MAKNTAAQNPSNKVGRYSGAGRAGISEIVPSEAEARRGLQPMQVSEGGWRPGRLGMGLGALAVLGAGAAAFLVQRARQPRGIKPRLQRMVGWR